MALINSLITWRLKKRSHLMELFIKYPIEVQEECLKNLLHVAQNTEWGKKYDFKSIQSPREYAQRVPLQDYESIKNDINRTRQGVQNVIWPSEIKWFAKSSGTTNNKSKYIPVSEEALKECHYKAGKDMLSIYCNQVEKTTVFTGKTLMMGGSHKIDKRENMFAGDLSAILIENLPYWVSRQQLPEKEVMFLDDWEKKLELMAESVIPENLTSLSGVPSWTIVLFNRILEKTGANDLREIWPNLELYMHGGVKFDPYRKHIEQLAPGLNYIETYNASEGFFGIQYELGVSDFLLMLDYGIYYEFIPLDSVNDDSPSTVLLSEVELGKTYALVISTNTGLWRYQVGDTIEFTSTNPYRFKLSGRTKHFINAFGEEVMIDNTDKALAMTCAALNINVSDYTAAPEFLNNNSGKHVWAIEFDDNESINKLKFGKVLDQSLKDLNSDYEAKRSNDLVLKPLEIISLPKGTFYNWLKSKNKLGGQNKVPRLTQNMDLINEIRLFVSKQ